MFCPKAFCPKVFCPKAFCPKCKHRIGLTSLYWPQVRRRTSDRGYVKRSFLWSVGPSVGGESDSEGHCRTADGRKFLLLLEPPGNFYSSSRRLCMPLYGQYTLHYPPSSIHCKGVRPYNLGLICINLIFCREMKQTNKGLRLQCIFQLK